MVVLLVLDGDLLSNPDVETMLSLDAQSGSAFLQSDLRGPKQCTIGMIFAFF